MGQSKNQKIDQALADELAVSLSPFKIPLKRLPAFIPQSFRLVFAWQKAGMLYYDTAFHFRHVNGCRLRCDHLAITETTCQRLTVRHYSRWFAVNDDHLYVIHTGKPTDLEMYFTFCVEHDALCPTQMVSPITETMGTRKSILKSCQSREPEHPWEELHEMHNRPFKAHQVF